MIGIFSLFALLQVNDPDPFVWIAVYGITALLTYLDLQGYHWKVENLICSATFLLGATFLLFTSTQFHLHNEEFREGLGMMICSVWLGFLSVRLILTDA